MRPSTLLVIVAVLLEPLSAHAAERSKMAKMAILDLKTTGNFDPKDVAALSSFIASEAGHYSVKVIAGSDLQTLLGFEKQKQLMGCTEGSCFAEIGGALGVDFLLASEVGQVGGRWLLSIALLDVAKASALQRASRAAKTQAELVDLVSVVVEETFAGIIVAKTPAKDAAATLVPPPLPPKRAGPESAAAPPAASAVESGAEAHTGGSRRVAGYALIGGGAALLIGGGVAGILAYAQHADAVKAGPPPSQAVYDATKNGISTKAWIADGLYAAGIVAAGVGLALVLTAPSGGVTSHAPAPSASVSAAPIIGGGALVVSGGF